MSYLSEFCTTIRRWLDDQGEYSDEVITEWVRDAEERLNNELRVNEQITREYATFDDNCTVLPPDWLEHIYVRVKGGTPFHYVTPDSYWLLKEDDGQLPLNLSGEVPIWTNKKMHYTTIGQTLFIWPQVDPEALVNVEIAYYRKILPLGDQKDPVFDRFPSIYRNTTLAAGAPYLMEDERFNQFAGMATGGITRANEAAKLARWSGSPLAPRIRAFG